MERLLGCPSDPQAQVARTVVQLMKHRLSEWLDFDVEQLKAVLNSAAKSKDGVERGDSMRTESLLVIIRARSTAYRSSVFASAVRWRAKFCRHKRSCEDASEA